MNRGQIINSVLFLLLLFRPSTATSQTQVDTIRGFGHNLIIEYPVPNTKSTTNYEEGFFKGIACKKDTAFIMIHCGAMVATPLFNKKNKVVLSQYLVQNEIVITRGYVETTDGIRKYFREDNFYGNMFNILYENVPEEKVAEYERYFNNIKIIKAQQ
jgi:hypothetical protein